VKRHAWLAWLLLGVWSAWIFAFQGLCAARMQSSSWVPDIGLVLLLSLAARLTHQDLPKAALVIAIARCAVSIDAPVAVIAAYCGAVALARALRGVFEIGGALPRTLLAGASAWLVTAWLAIVHDLRDARLAMHTSGTPPDIDELAHALTTSWPPALSTALAALLLGPLLAQLPGLTPLRKKRQWHVIASSPWS
jgi:hypothetical protein